MSLVLLTLACGNKTLLKYSTNDKRVVIVDGASRPIELNIEEDIVFVSKEARFFLAQRAISEVVKKTMISRSDQAEEEFPFVKITRLAEKMISSNEYSSTEAKMKRIEMDIAFKLSVGEKEYSGKIILVCESLQIQGKEIISDGNFEFENNKFVSEEVTIEFSPRLVVQSKNAFELRSLDSSGNHIVVKGSGVPLSVR